MSRAEEIFAAENKTEKMMLELVKNGTSYDSAIQAGILDQLTILNESLARVVDVLEGANHVDKA